MTKAQNVLCFDGLKHNLFNVSQMCDNGHEAILRSKDSEIKNDKS